MKAIFVNENGCVPYAHALVQGYKTDETRSRDMLSALVGERVAVARTKRGKAPLVVGYVTITEKTFCNAEDFAALYNRHLVPSGSAYDARGKGKWLYHVADPEECTPYPLPSSAVRHGRSWCEF